MGPYRATSLSARLLRLEARIPTTSAPATPPLRVIDLLTWPAEARGAYRAALAAGDPRAADALVERIEGFRPDRPSAPGPWAPVTVIEVDCPACFDDEGA